MPREKLQHVVEKTNSSRDLVLSPTLNGQHNPNLGFGGLAMQLGFSHVLTSPRNPSFSTASRSASIRICVCLLDPTVRRTQPLHPGSVLRSRMTMPRSRKA